MRVTRDKCLQCGTRAKPSRLDSKFEYLESTGHFKGTPYWFCSSEHYKEALKKYIPERYSFDKNPEEDDEELIERRAQISDEYSTSPECNMFNCSSANQFKYIQKHFNPILSQWYSAQRAAILDAERIIANRIYAEWEHEQKEEAEEKRKEQEKLDEKQRKLDAEEDARIQAEEDRREMLKPKPIPFEYRFDHTHILGSSGQGKSTLIIKQFVDDFNLDKHPALIVIDPKGTMVEQLRRLRVFQLNDNPMMRTMDDMPVIIDPTLFPPALNMFAPPKRHYPPNIAQQLQNNTINLFQYIFITKGSALTDKQMTCFSFAVPLILSIPNATIHTLLDLMSDKPIQKTGGIRPDSPFKPFVDKLGDTAKRFFYESFYDIAEYGATKDQIATRIFGMLRYPVFDAMFSTTDNKLDMFDCLQKGRVVLISSPKSILGTEGSKIFSRYMVALTLQAAFERKTIEDKKKWHPAFLVIDEAQDVIDEVKTPELLEQAREFKLGVTLAHQNIKGQLPDALFSSISANTRIKYAGTRSYQDASMMSRDMHCEPDFITKQGIGSFACFVGGMTEHPFQVKLKLGEIDDYEMMSDEEFGIIRSILDQHFLGITHKGPTEADLAPSPVKSDAKAALQARPPETKPTKPASPQQNPPTPQPQTPPSVDPTDAGGPASEW